jgi:dynein heavy chain 2
LFDIVNESKGGIPQWQKIYGILENAIYGGRIDNTFDLRVLRAYIEEYFNEQTLRG